VVARSQRGLQSLTELLEGGLLLAGDIGSVWVRGYAANGRILKVCRATDDPDRIITAAYPI